MLACQFSSVPKEMCIRDSYFYALDEDGTHHFSETAEEHEQFLENLRNGRDDDDETQEP